MQGLSYIVQDMNYTASSNAGTILHRLPRQGLYCFIVPCRDVSASPTPLENQYSNSCLSFGLSLAPSAFSGDRRFPFRILRERNISFRVSRDGCVNWGRSETACQGAVKEAFSGLRYRGFLVNLRVPPALTRSLLGLGLEGEALHLRLRLPLGVATSLRTV